MRSTGRLGFFLHRAEKSLQINKKAHTLRSLRRERERERTESLKSITRGHNTEGGKRSQHSDQNIAVAVRSSSPRRPLAASLLASFPATSFANVFATAFATTIAAAIAPLAADGDAAGEAGAAVAALFAGRHHRLT